MAQVRVKFPRTKLKKNKQRTRYAEQRWENSKFYEYTKEIVSKITRSSLTIS